MLATDNVGSATKALAKFRDRTELLAFEFFSDRALDFVLRANPGLPTPFSKRHPAYVLAEVADSNNALTILHDLFEHLTEAKIIRDGVISQSTAQARALWKYREDVSESLSYFRPFKNDVSVRISRLPSFLAETESALQQKFPDVEIIWFGHLGDGNLHINIIPADETNRSEHFDLACKEIAPILFKLVRDHGGSISAEHGIGLLKKPFLRYSVSQAEIDYMKAIKNSFDPEWILNPGKIFDRAP